MENSLTVEDLFSLEEYSSKRAVFRDEVMKHKRVRRLEIGPNLTLYFESKLTIQYQVQEMLRIEKIFERAAIEEELSAYTSLIPDKRNFKATMMLEYVDESVRRRKLQELKGVERGVWLKVGNEEKAFANADEDLEREDRAKTSAVHFLRFAITSSMTTALRLGDRITLGVDHSAYVVDPVEIQNDMYKSLMADLK